MFYTPNNWVILTIKQSGTPIINKVFASWNGGQLRGDTWKLSSGITDMDFSEPDRVEIENISGSVYTCYKNRYGMNSTMNLVYENWLSETVKTDYEIVIHDTYSF